MKRKNVLPQQKRKMLNSKSKLGNIQTQWKAKYKNFYLLIIEYFKSEEKEKVSILNLIQF